MTLVALPGVFYTIRWNYSFYLPFDKSFWQIALIKFYWIEKGSSYAVSFTSNNLWLSVSKALYRFYKYSTNFFVFIKCVHLYISQSYLVRYFKVFWVLWFLRNSVNSGKNVNWKIRFICFKTILSNILHA